MYQYTCLNAISPVGLGRFTKDYQQVDDIKQADGVLVRSTNMHEMEIPENVLAIGRAGAGVNNIPLEKCADKGIVVFNTPGANANGVKEMVFAGMLLAARDVVGGINWVSSQAGNENVTKDTEKVKKQFAGSELSGKKLGIIGLGAIGVLVANAATHLGMEVYGYDPYISVDAAWNLSRSIKHINDVDEIYRQCDYITIHVPLLESTKGMIGEDAIRLMKKNAVILNFARDLLVDEDAVLAALSEGRIGKYVSDFPNTKTVGKPGVIVVPHLGASTAESEDNCAVMAVNEMMDFLENGNIRNSVNYPNCNLGVCETATRVAIYHKNVKMMISRFTNILSHTNIVNMSNTSRGQVAYTLLDLEDRLDEETVEMLRSVEGVMRVRLVK